MTDAEREEFNACVRMRDFGAENAADFPAASVGAVNFKVFEDNVPLVEASGEMQTSNAGKAATVSKHSAVSEVLHDLREINRTARSIAVDKPEVGELFRMPHGDNLQKLLAAAMDFHTHSADYETDFIDYHLPADFRARLQSDIDDLQTATVAHNNAKSSKTGATGAVKSHLELMRDARLRLLGIVPNVYRGNPAKLAAWASASHVARPAKKSGGTPTPAPHS